MPRLWVFGSSGRFTKGNLKIVNSTLCTFKRTSESSQQMEDWDTNWPMEIQPHSEVEVPVVFMTRKSIPIHLDQGEVSYEVFDNAGLSLATFRISASSEDSTVSCCCLWTFKGKLEVDWETLPKVFGVTVTPREGKAVGFKRNRTVTITISGKVLPGGPRDERSQVKLGDFKAWDDMAPECEPGDVIGADRGAFRHYGIVEKIEPDGTVMISNLVGTAGGLLSKHGLGGGVKQVYSALTGSHGDIAGVTTQPLKEFAEGDKCRVENLMDDEWKCYEPSVIANRINIATGFRDYSLFEFNCEHYANLIRYGMPYSEQIEALTRKFDMAEQGKILKAQFDQKMEAWDGQVTQLGSKITKEFSSVQQKFVGRFSRDSKEDEKNKNEENGDSTKL